MPDTLPRIDANICDLALKTREAPAILAHQAARMRDDPDGWAGSTPSEGCVSVQLAYRPPYDTAAMIGFFQRRQIDGVEWVGNSTPTSPAHVARTLRLRHGAQDYQGWFMAHFDAQNPQLHLQVSDSLRQVLPQVIRRVRHCFDLDADPHAINAVLHAPFPYGDGLRVPGSPDGFELAVRAVLGQQITVAAARTLAQRLVAQWGESVTTPHAQLSRLFPTALALADASADALGTLGIVRQRQGAIQALSRAVASGQLNLSAGVDIAATMTALKELPGIGDWTVHYIAMRALRWPDAFPKEDIVVRNNLGGVTAKQAEALSQAWRPWRSYAVMHIWRNLA